MEMVTILIKGKGITEDPSSRDRLASWKNNDGQFTVPNPNDLCKQEKLRKNLSGQSEYINLQQRCNLLDKKLKVIEGMDNLKSVDPRELCLVLTWSYRPTSKCQNLKSTMEANALRTIWPRIVTRWLGTPIMRICWSMCSTIVWQGQQLNGIWSWRRNKFVQGEI